MENVLDASAIMALLLKEHGHQQVVEALAVGSCVSTVNISEVADRCVRAQMPNAVIRQLVGSLPLTLVEHDAELAYRAGEMVAVTRPFGLSLGDRCCLALAGRESLPAITADRRWSEVSPLLGIAVRLIR